MRIGDYKLKWTALVKIVSLAIAIACIGFSDRRPQQFWIIPCLYTLLIVVCQYNTIQMKNNPGAIIMNATMFMRYDILILIIYLTGESSRFARNTSYLSEAVYLMVYEMIAVFIALELSGRIYCKKEYKLENSNEGRLEVYYIKDGFLIALVAIAILLGIATTYKDLSAGFMVIISGSLEQNSKALSNNAVDIIWQVLCVWIYTYSILREAKAHELDASEKHANRVILYTFIFVLISFIESVAFSRWYTIITACASFVCICHLFPSYRKKFTLSIVVPASFLLVLITAYKNGGYVADGGGFLESVQSLFNVSTIDSYFCGPYGVNSAIGLKETSNLGFFTMFSDALNNMPIINHYIQGEKTSVYAFAAYIGRLWGNGGDQIIPLIGQSTIYFGYIFSPILSVISVLLVRHFDYKFKITSSYMMYVYAFSSVWYAVVANMLNLTINLSWVYIRLIPFTIALSFTSKIASRSTFFRE